VRRARLKHTARVRRHCEASSDQGHPHRPAHYRERPSRDSKSRCSFDTKLPELLVRSAQGNMVTRPFGALPPLSSTRRTRQSTSGGFSDDDRRPVARYFRVDRPHIIECRGEGMLGHKSVIDTHQFRTVGSGPARCGRGPPANYRRRTPRRGGLRDAAKRHNRPAMPLQTRIQRHTALAALRRWRRAKPDGPP
jgi:hypothetical protein